MNIRNRVKELRHVRAGDLVPNPRNWRRHPQAQQDALRGVLAEIGYADALIARKVKGGKLMLIDGHLRAEVTPDTKVPVLVVDLTEAEADKLLATLDPLAAMAEADAGKLADLLAGVETESEALRAMMDDLAKSAPLPTPEVVEDEVPEPPANPITKQGDLWLLGDHRLLCGDSTKAEDVARLMGVEKADLCVTSPPYNCDIEYDQHDDRMDRDKYLSFIAAIVARIHEVLGDGRFVAWNVGVSPKSMHFEHARILSECFEFYRQIVWAKSGVAFPTWQYTSGPRIARKYHPNYCHEVIFLFSNGDAEAGETCDVDDTYSSDVWRIHQSAASRDLPGESNGRRPRVADHGGAKAAAHPAAYPIGIPAGAIKHLTAQGELTYEPFAGSGTTLIAAEQLNRRCYGMEISPAYCDVIVQRWENLTGKKAKREGRKRG